MLRAVTLVLVLAAVLATPAAARRRYVDPSGETAGAADIGAVTVTNNPVTQTVWFSVDVAGLPALQQRGDGLALWIDSDGRSTTGQGGVDCVVGLAPEGYAEGRWSHGRFVPSLGDGPSIHFADGVFTVVMSIYDCGLSRSFRFFVVSHHGPAWASAVVDRAPDTGFYEYARSTSSPVVMSSKVTTNAPPQAGGVFMVISDLVEFSDGMSTYAKGMTCRATLAGAVLPGTGVGGCTFTLPRRSRGKRLVVRVTGNSGGDKRERFATTRAYIVG